MSAPTAADYAAAKSLLAAVAEGRPKMLTDCGLRAEDVIGHALAIAWAEIRQREILADPADGDLLALIRAQDKAIAALVALAANADGAP